MLTEFSRDCKTLCHFSHPFEHNEGDERDLWGEPKIKASSEEQARMVWQMMDPDLREEVDVHQFSYLLGTFGLPLYEVEATINIYKGENGRMNFERFYREMEYLWSFLYYEGVSEMQQNRKRAQHKLDWAEKHKRFSQLCHQHEESKNSHAHGGPVLIGRIARQDKYEANEEQSAV